MRLRQVALAAEALEPARTQLFELLGLQDDFLDEGVAEFGLTNSVMALGDSFLEIVAPTRGDTAAGRALGRRGVSACGYMALFQVDDYAAFDAHAEALDLRKVWEAERDEVSACHIHPKDIGGAIVSFDEMRPAEDWVWGGPDWRERRASEVTGIAGCTLCSPSHANLAASWSRVMQIAPIDTPSGQRILCGDGTFIDFVPGERYEGIQSVTFACEDPDALYARAEAIGLGSKQAPAIGDFALRFTATPVN